MCLIERLGAGQVQSKMADRKESFASSLHSVAMSGAAVRKGGLSMGMTGFFLVAEMAGAGFLALPRALADTGWLGVAMMLVFCLSVGFVGTRLGRSFNILEERWPEEYKETTRVPYMSIAERAFGPTGRKVTLWIIILKLLGSTTVHMILISEMLTAVVQELAAADCPITKCQVIMIVAACLMPLTWLGSPKDFWQASVLAVVATVVVVVVIVVQIFVNDDDFPTPTYPNPTVQSFALGFGAILFAYGGSAVFPTIQNDMADRTQFSKSVIIGFSAIIAMYVPVALAGYIKIGDAVESNILLSVEMTDAVIAAIMMQIVNLLCTFLISSNPVHQSVEELFRVPNKFGPKRILVRSMVVMLQMFIGLAVPNFSAVLNLIGGSLITLCTFVLPPVMYMRLVDNKSDKSWPERTIPLWERVFLWEVVAVGTVGGILSTITAFMDVIETSFNNSCFTDFNTCPADVLEYPNAIPGPRDMPPANNACVRASTCSGLCYICRR